MKNYLTFVISFLFLLGGFEAMAGPTDPEASWQVLKSEHFRIIHEPEHLALAEHYARAAEKAYTQLALVFSELPEISVMVLMDNTDIANGSAHFMPESQMVLHPVLPRPGSSINHYDDWAELLSLHEMAHLASFEPVHGFYLPFRYLFGSVITPTAFLPRWFLEGLAVKMESHLSSHGRLRSPVYQAYLRALFQGEPTYESLARINESEIYTWPFGRRPYFYGSLLLNELDTDEKMTEKLLQTYSRRLPYLLNGPIEDLAGLSYSELLYQTQLKYTQAAQAQIEQIRKFDISDDGSEPVSLKQAGFNHSLPSISPNGQHLVYLATNPEKRKGELRILSRDLHSPQNFSKVEPKTLRQATSATRISWLPDSSGFIFDQIINYKRYYEYRDLFHYNLESQELTRLTQGERAFDAEIYGDLIYFIANVPGGTELRVLNRKDNIIKALYKPPLGYRLARPIVLGPQKILIHRKDNKGHEGIYVLDLNNKKIAPWMKTTGPIQNLKQTRKHILYVSSETGVPNLYLSNFSGRRVRAFTNTATGIGSAEYDFLKKQVIVSQLTSDGYQLFLIEKPKPQSPLKVEPLIDIPEVIEPSMDPIDVSVEDYNSFKYMLPKYWIPVIYPVEDGVLFQGATTANDPLMLHQYSLSGSYDTVTKEASYDLSYMNRMSPVEWGLFHSEYNSPFGFDSDIILTNRAFGASAGFFLTSSDRWLMSFNYVHLDTEGLTQTPIKRQGPELSLSVKTDSSGHPDYEDPIDDKMGIRLTLGHQEFLDQEEYLPYGRTRASAVAYTSFWRSHQLSLNLKGVFAPKLPENYEFVVGETTVGGNYIANLYNTSLLLRGYASGIFYAREIINYNLQYSFPLTDLNRGYGTFPVFLRSVNCVLFADGAGLHGGFFDIEGNIQQTSLSRFFHGAGAEFHISTTVGYHFPLNLIVGAYYGFDEYASQGFSLFTGIGFSGHEGLKSSFASTRSSL